MVLSITKVPTSASYRRPSLPLSLFTPPNLTPQALSSAVAGQCPHLRSMASAVCNEVNLRLKAGHGGSKQSILTTAVLVLATVFSGQVMQFYRHQTVPTLRIANGFHLFLTLVCPTCISPVAFNTAQFPADNIATQHSDAYPLMFCISLGFPAIVCICCAGL